MNTSDAPLRTAPAPRRKVGDQPGQIADRESVAAALKEALDIKPGKPLAAGGLDIKTSIARWSVTTRLTVVPRNPVVRVVFGREGNVIKADFIKGYDTGAASVDEPLLDAIYRWKASGEPLKTLPTGDPNAGVSLIFRILLREPG